MDTAESLGGRLPGLNTTAFLRWNQRPRVREQGEPLSWRILVVF